MDAPVRRAMAADSLTGLSVGDALGERYIASGAPFTGELPPGPWGWTDDTEMACTVTDLLAREGSIEPDTLAAAFAERCVPERGYGPGAVVLLRRIAAGASWRVEAPAMFDGAGSCGNGGAMRVAPLGAYFADDPDRLVSEAVASSAVTHSHPEGVAGTVAVALAAGYVTRCRLERVAADPDALFAAVLDRLAEGEVRTGVARAGKLLGRPVPEVAAELGNGSRLLAQDTVAFALWAAAEHLGSYPAAVSACLVAGGDMDTTAAIAGGVVAAYTGIEGNPQAPAGVVGVPPSWLVAREPLPAWLTT